MMKRGRITINNGTNAEMEGLDASIISKGDGTVTILFHETRWERRWSFIVVAGLVTLIVVNLCQLFWHIHSLAR